MLLCLHDMFACRYHHKPSLSDGWTKWASYPTSAFFFSEKKLCKGLAAPAFSADLPPLVPSSGLSSSLVALRYQRITLIASHVKKIKWKSQSREGLLRASYFHWRPDEKRFDSCLASLVPFCLTIILLTDTILGRTRCRVISWQSLCFCQLPICA